MAIEFDPEGIKGPKVHEKDGTGHLLTAKCDLLRQELILKDALVHLEDEFLLHQRDGTDRLVSQCFLDILHVPLLVFILRLLGSHVDFEEVHSVINVKFVQLFLHFSETDLELKHRHIDELCLIYHSEEALWRAVNGLLRSQRNQELILQYFLWLY